VGERAPRAWTEGRSDSMCRSMSKRDRQRAARRRDRADQHRRARRGEALVRLVFDPSTAPDRAAALLQEVFGEAPVEPVVAPTIVVHGGIARAGAVAQAALGHKRGPMALSLAADVALIDGRPGDAERHLVQALELADDPLLHLRLAMARAGQGRLADALEGLYAQLTANPGLQPLQLLTGDLLEQVQERAGSPPAGCPCGSGGRYVACCQPADARALARFRDRTTVVELQVAVARFAGATKERGEAFAAGVLEWVEAGAVTEGELRVPASAAPGDPRAGRKRLIGEWAWSMPLLDGESILHAFAADPHDSAESRRRAADWQGWATWGLWEVGRPVAAPGVAVTELLSGTRLYVEVPSTVLAGVPRWSVLLGCVLPVDGVWRMADGFEVASPIEARELAHELIDELLDQPGDVGRERRPLVAWARRIHDRIGELWLPGAVEPPPGPALNMLQATMHGGAPNLVASLRRMQGTAGADPELLWAGLTVDDPDAAWQALAGQPEFEAHDDELVWFEAREEGETEDDPRWVRATVSVLDDQLVVEPESAGDLAELQDLLQAVGHPVLTVDEAVDDRPHPPVALPEEGVGAWLRAWPDEPLEVLDGLSPREALRRHHAEAEVEVLIRYLEHDADRRGSSGLDTQALRRELEVAGETPPAAKQ
jgi:hypothetical protein